MAKVEPIMVDAKVNNKAISQAIKQVRKLNKRTIPSTATSTNPASDILISIAGIFIIFPVVIYGVLTFFGAGFKHSMEGAIRMYNELMDDAKTWAR